MRGLAYANHLSSDDGVHMTTVKMVPEEAPVGRVKKVYDEIKAQLGIDFVSHLHRVMAHKPEYLEPAGTRSRR